MLARGWILSVLVALVLWPGAVIGQSQRYLEVNERLVELYRQGRYEEALPLAKEALMLGEKALGPNHTTIASLLDNLAAVYSAQAEFAEAEPLYKRALAIREKLLGRENPKVASNLNNLAAVYRAQGKYTHAEPLYKRSIAILEKAFGPDHRDVAQTRDQLAKLYRAQGEAARPIQQVHRGVVLIARAPDPGIRYDIAITRQHEALAIVRRALDAFQQESPSSARALETLKKAGDVVILYDPSFPGREYSKLTFAAFLPEIPDFLRSRFPDVFNKYGDAQDRRIFFAVLGRYVIKHSVAEIAGAIAHELVGHGIQHLRGRLHAMRQLDLECEARLYQLNVYQDFKLDKFSHEMIAFRKELEEIHCDDFKRHIRNHRPSLIKLWDTLDVDVPRLLDLFESYVKARYG